MCRFICGDNGACRDVSFRHGQGKPIFLFYRLTYKPVEETLDSSELPTFYIRMKGYLDFGREPK